MKEFVLKYITYDGKEKITTVQAVNEIDAERKLRNCREVIWCRFKERLSERFTHIHSVK